MQQTFQQIRITPDMARKWLEHNLVNRPISRATVKAYADDMICGRWDKNTTSCIAFDRVGRLVDGQHRLSAIIVAGIPVTMWVSRNVGDGVVFDSGRNRSLSDFMNIAHPELESIYHSTKMVALIRVVAALAKTGNASARVTQKMLEQFFFEHKEDFDAFATILNHQHVAKVTITLVWTAMFFAHKGGVSLTDLDHFYSVLASGIPESPRDYPIIAYRDYLLKSPTALSVTNEEIMRCQGSIKKYLTKSHAKTLSRPKDYIWAIPYKEA